MSERIDPTPGPESRHRRPFDFTGQVDAATFQHLMNRKEMGLKGIAILAFAAVASGCSGISATGGVSPLSFLLPGLVLDESPRAPLTGRPLEAPARTENNS